MGRATRDRLLAEALASADIVSERATPEGLNRLFEEVERAESFPGRLSELIGARGQINPAKLRRATAITLTMNKVLATAVQKIVHVLADDGESTVDPDRPGSLEFLETAGSGVRWLKENHEEDCEDQDCMMAVQIRVLSDLIAAVSAIRREVLA